MDDTEHRPEAPEAPASPKPKLPLPPPFGDLPPRAQAPEEWEEPEPMEFPRGFWRGVDFLLRYPKGLSGALKAGDNLPGLCGSLALVSLAMSALYGAIMGATNLLQGSSLAIGDKLLMIVVASIKTPVLFLLTLLIILPPVYVSNAFAGAKLTFWRMTAVLLTGTAVGTMLLASMASVAFFFALTSLSYDFIKLLHVLFFAYGGVGGLVYFSRVLEATGERRRRTPLQLMLLWFFLYMFVGTQLAWVLRPFVASPGEPFQVFRARSGNFYESVIHSMGRVVSQEDGPPGPSPNR